MRKFLYVTLITIILLEVLSRIIYPDIDLMVLTGRKAGLSGMHNWAYTDAFAAYTAIPGEYDDAGKTVNSYGFISTPELASEKADGTTRIVFLGGSSTAGTGVNLPDEETWPWQAHQKLQKSYPEQNIEFINAALGGYSTFESYGRLWSRVRFFEPDVIVVYHGWNEMYYFDDVDTILDWRVRESGNWDLISRSQRFQPHPADYILYPSHFLSLVRISLSEDRGEFGNSGELKSTYDERGLEVFRTNLQLIQQAATLMNAELYVVKQATLITEQTPHDVRWRARVDFHGFDYEAHTEAYQAIYDVIDAEIPSAYVIDATGLSGQPDLFFDHVHLTPVGAREVATVVSVAIEP